MRCSLMLCDWAQVLQGKLYAQGAGWNNINADEPAAFGIAAMVRIDFNETNTQRHAVITLVDEDGHPFPTAPQPLRIEFDFEVGRPPGMKLGQEQIVCFAINVNGVVFPVGGYELQLHVNDHRQDMVPFTSTRRASQ